MCVRYNYVEYVLLAILAIDSVLGILIRNFYLVLVSIALCSVIAIFHYFKEFFDSLVFKHTDIVQVLDGYELGGDRTVVTRKMGQKYIATAGGFLNIESGSLDKDKIENIIAHFSYPFRFSMVVERLNAVRILDTLQTKRNMKEIELSRIGDTNKGRGLARAMGIKRGIEQLEHDIKSISGGYAPVRVAYYIATSAESERRYAAEEEAKAHARGLLGAFDSALGSTSNLSSGNSLLRIIRMDSMITSGELDGL